MLAGRNHDLAPLTEAVDHTLVAAVLLDHLQDWSDDLAAGRYNSFVAYASPLAQTRGRRRINRQKAVEELYLGVAARPYFEIAANYVRSAGSARVRSNVRAWQPISPGWSWRRERNANAGQRKPPNSGAQ